MKAPTPSPSPDTNLDEADMEEEDDEVLDEEEEEEEEVDEEEAEEEEEEEQEEEEEEAIAVKDPDEYEYPIDAGPYQTSDYLDSFYYEKNHKPTTSTPLIKGESRECISFVLCLICPHLQALDNGTLDNINVGDSLTLQCTNT